MKTTIIVSFVIFCFLFFYQNGIAQERTEKELFEMEYDGESVQVTQKVSPHLLGTYVQNEGKNIRTFQLGLTEEKSYILLEFPKDPFEKISEEEIKQYIRWGVLTHKGELAYHHIQEFEDGKIKKYKGLVVIIQDLETKKNREYLLYETNGKLVLGGVAVKVPTDSGS